MQSTQLSSYELRYYSSPYLRGSQAVDDYIARLLVQVARRLGLGCRVVEVEPGKEQYIYKTDFNTKLARCVHKQLGYDSVSSVYKSGKGYVYIGGLIALYYRDSTGRGSVVWSTRAVPYGSPLLREWRRLAEAAAMLARLGVAYNPLSFLLSSEIGFLLWALRSPGEALQLIKQVDAAVRACLSNPTPRSEHNILEIELALQLARSEPNAAIILEAPLGLKLISERVGGDPQAIESYLLRADVVMLLGVSGLDAGVYVGFRGERGRFNAVSLAHTLSKEYGVPASTISAYDLASVSVDVAHIYEVKTGAPREDAIGQLYVYRELLKYTLRRVGDVKLFLAAPAAAKHSMNPLLESAARSMGIGFCWIEERGRLLALTGGFK